VRRPAALGYHDADPKASNDHAGSTLAVSIMAPRTAEIGGAKRAIEVSEFDARLKQLEEAFAEGEPAAPPDVHPADARVLARNGRSPGY
jgi:hypothetical protein